MRVISNGSTFGGIFCLSATCDTCLAGSLQPGSTETSARGYQSRGSHAAARISPAAIHDSCHGSPCLVELRPEASFPCRHLELRRIPGPAGVMLFGAHHVLEILLGMVPMEACHRYCSEYLCWILAAMYPSLKYLNYV